MEVGTGAYFDAFVVDGFVEALQQRGVRPDLVGRMNGFDKTSTQRRFDNRILGGCAGLAPLLQFDQYRIFSLILIAACQQKVDSFR
ncbi:hypothetical protein D3C84_663830 [compost metagenome]